MSINIIFIVVFTGFLFGDVNLDKDGVRAAAVFAEMNIQLRKQGLSAVQQLEKIYKLYERCSLTVINSNNSIQIRIFHNT